MLKISVLRASAQSISWPLDKGQSILRKYAAAFFCLFCSLSGQLAFVMAGAERPRFQRSNCRVLCGCVQAVQTVTRGDQDGGSRPRVMSRDVVAS